MKDEPSAAIADCYYFLKDFKKAEQFYLLAKDKGNIKALFTLALLYHTEFKDFKKAEQFYLLAIDKGNIKALNNLAVLYHFEFKDFKKAEQFYLLAIDKGDVEPLFNLALLYHFEFKDFKKAEQLYLRAIDKGDVKALNNLALLYQNEFKDFKKAEQLYLRAIDKGDVDALNNLAFLYFNAKENYSIALKYANEAIKLSDRPAHNHTLAFIYLWGKEINKSLDLTDKFLFSEEFLAGGIEWHFYLYILLAKNQYSFLENYFSSEKAKALNIKDRLKPIYYALLYYLRDKYPNEYLRMGDELKETVEEIIAVVERMRAAT